MWIIVCLPWFELFCLHVSYFSLQFAHRGCESAKLDRTCDTSTGEMLTAPFVGPTKPAHPPEPFRAKTMVRFFSGAIYFLSSYKVVLCIPKTALYYQALLSSSVWSNRSNVYYEIHCLGGLYTYDIRQIVCTRLNQMHIS